MKKSLLFLGLLASMFAIAETTVRTVDQKMVLSQDGVQTILTPSGADESYYWCSVSPDGTKLLYSTAYHGTCVCDLDGSNVISLGRLNAPKWMDNSFVMGMQESYDINDEITSVRYLARDINSLKERNLSSVEQATFIAAENIRREAQRAENTAARMAPGRRAPQGEGSLSGLKIYLNPGHGGYDANDRSCWTIPVPETWSNPAGYWESKSNLMKALLLKDMLEKAGANVIISRTENTSGERDIEYYPGASAAKLDSLEKGGDRDLSAIAEEANANGVDHFLSIHSNALNSQTNYLLLLWHGYNNQPTVAMSDSMAMSSGNLQIENKLTVWTSAKPLFRGDFDFYGDDMGLGVLRPLTVPGFLSEGSFHDYPPESHRLMNEDYCHLEALRMFQHFHKYFKRTLPQTATISGWVKSSNELVDVLNQPKFLYVKNSDDQWLPINGAKVELLQNDVVVAEKTTDNWYNGVFAFYDLTPGTYVLRVTCENYKTTFDTVTVKAEEIAGEKIRMKNIHLNPANYQEPETEALALDSYDFELVNEKDIDLAKCARVLYRNGYLYALMDGAVHRYDLNMTTSTAVVMPAGVTFSDIAFASDDYLFAKVKGSTDIYMWDDDFLNPVVSEYKAVNASDDYIAVSGPHWNAKVYSNASNVVIAMDGTALADNAALFRYGKHAYNAHVVSANGAVQFQLMDITANPAVVASALYPTTPLTATWSNIAAWVEGTIIHVLLATEGHISHFQTVAANVLNIYAGECTYKDGQIAFRLNEDATNVTITFEKNDEVLGTWDGGAMKKGYHNMVNPINTTDFDVINITATARPVSAIVKVSDDSECFQFYAGRGVAVDKCPTSPYFGRIYVSESFGGQCSNDVGGGWPAPSYRNMTQGIFVLGSDFSDVTNQGTNGWNGGIDWGTNASGSYQFALARPNVAPDGDVFVTSTTLQAGGVYIMDPANPAAAFQPVFDGKRSASNGQLKNRKDVVCNPVMHCWILGKGKDEVLYTFDRDISAGVSGCIWQYNIGEAESLPWNTVPSKVFFNNATQDNHMQNSNGQIAYDQHGGFFLSQYRYNSSWAVPGLLHCNKDGIKDFNISNNGVDAVQQGGMAVSVDGSLLALGTELGHVKIWDVEYDANGAPTLTPKYEIDWGNGAGNTYGVDFDYAGNLYIISNSNERLMVYSLPKIDNSCTTRLVVREKGTGIEDVENNVLNTMNVEKRIENGVLYIIRNGVRYNAQGVVIE